MDYFYLLFTPPFGVPADWCQIVGVIAFSFEWFIVRGHVRSNMMYQTPKKPWINVGKLMEPLEMFINIYKYRVKCNFFK